MSFERAVHKQVRRETAQQVRALKAEVQQLKVRFGELQRQLGVLASLGQRSPASSSRATAAATQVKGSRARLVHAPRSEGPAPQLAPAVPLLQATQAQRGCAVIGCKRPHRSRGYCGAHYQRRRTLEASGRLPAAWVFDAPEGTLPEVLVSRRLRTTADAVPAEAALPAPSGRPAVWRRRPGASALEPLVPAARTEPSTSEG